MTIHKAKGLEFDTVIVPGLHRASRRDDSKLIVWTEHPNPETGARELLLAPIRETGAEDDVESDAIYRYVLTQEREKQQHEYVRLLYVAATRAERRLHLLGAVRVKADDVAGDGTEMFFPPRADTLLAALWPAVAAALWDDLHAAPAESHAPTLPVALAPVARPPLGPMRITRTQPLPAMPDAISVQTLNGSQRQPSDEIAIDFEWASEAARHIGSVVHACLQQIAEEGVAAWNDERIVAMMPTLERELARRGVAAAELTVSISKVIEALSNTLADGRGRWTLQPHEHARAEWRLTGMQHGNLVDIAIDRTFIDDQNVRWIVDFKTGSHEGGDPDTFLDNEQKRYAAQLETYATILNAMSSSSQSRSIRLGLYFPMLKGWREWEWKHEQ